MTLLQPPSHAGQLRVSSLLLVSALSRAVDDAFLADGVRVVAELEARSLLRTGSHSDPACH